MVVETNGYIKVKWDRGRTSYIRHVQQANVQQSVADMEEGRNIIEEYAADLRHPGKGSQKR